jgi:hypothetical protein
VPILRNQRHEAFAQALAKGKTATEAMAVVGYADPRNSTRLTKNDEIRRRVEELQSLGAALAEITLGSLLAEIEHARLLAIRNRQAAAAIAASLAKAKLVGLPAGGDHIGQQIVIVTRDEAKL